MAHYAVLDKNNIVINVFVGKNEFEGGIDWEEYYSNYLGNKCLRTSYNTHGGVHSNNGEPFRKNYAAIGYLYDSDIDAFIPPKPYESWVLDRESCLWVAPVSMPENNGPWVWNEEELNWEPLSINI